MLSLCQHRRRQYSVRKERKIFMKPIIFARIADMEYYRGITDNDKPHNGGSYVHETGKAHECYNFAPVDSDENDYCLGFVMLIGNSKETDIQIRLENIIGCSACKKENAIEGVTVVWCATPENSQNTRVVGFYKNATVYRYPQQVEFIDENGEVSYLQQFNFIAKKEDCVLIPRHDRYTKSEWYIPLSGKHGYTFGFGRSHIWYANSEKKNRAEQEFVERMIKSIDNYKGKNLIDEEVV